MLLQVYSEVGGFGAGSDFTWQIFPTVGVQGRRPASRSSSATAGSTSTTRKGEGNERFTYDVLTQGPVAGVAFRF